RHDRRSAGAQPGRELLARALVLGAVVTRRTMGPRVLGSPRRLALAVGRRALGRAARWNLRRCSGVSWRARARAAAPGPREWTLAALGRAARCRLGAGRGRHAAGQAGVAVGAAHSAPRL